MFKNLSATDFARAITQNFVDQSHGVSTTFPRLKSNSVVSFKPQSQLAVRDW
jgi:hypothetical protein